MPQKCFVPGCPDTVLDGEVRHFFRPPRDTTLFDAWHDAIARPDNKRMDAKSRVCHVHFHADDIMREFVHNVNGDVVVIPRDKWALKEGAIPLLFPSYPKFLSRQAFQQQRQARISTRQEPLLFEDPDDPVETAAPPPPAPPSALEQAKEASRRKLCGELSELARQAERFHGWSVERGADESVVLFRLRVCDQVAQVERAVIVASDLKLCLNAGGRKVPSRAYANADGTLFTCLDGLRCFLDYVGSLRVCAGCPVEMYPHVSRSSTATRHGASWYHKTCAVLSARPVCPACHKLRMTFAKRAKGLYRGSGGDAAAARALRRKVIRATVRRERMKQELRAMKKEVQNVSKHMVDKMLGLLPREQRAAVASAFREAN